MRGTFGRFTWTFGSEKGVSDLIGCSFAFFFPVSLCAGGSGRTEAQAQESWI